MSMMSIKQTKLSWEEYPWELPGSFRTIAATLPSGVKLIVCRTTESASAKKHEVGYLVPVSTPVPVIFARGKMDINDAKDLAEDFVAWFQLNPKRARL